MSIEFSCKFNDDTYLVEGNSLLKISRIKQEPSFYVPKHGEEKNPAWLEPLLRSYLCGCDHPIGKRLVQACRLYLLLLFRLLDERYDQEDGFFDLTEVAPTKYRLLLCGFLFLARVSLAIIDMVTVALVTGLVCAKASRPTASILFSKFMVVTTRHGKKTCMLSLANACGNAVVAAEIELSSLIDEVVCRHH